MSFGSEVRRELISLKPENPQVEKAIILGLLHNSSEVIINSDGCKLLIKSHVLNVIKFISKYLKTHYQTVDKLSTKENNPLNEFRYYYLEITHNVLKIIEEFNLLNYDDLSLEILNLKTPVEQYGFLRGLFIAHGSVSDPRKSTYHFEISCTKPEIARIAQTIINSADLNCSVINRGNNSVVYLKKSENISQILVLIGALQGMFNFEDSRIYRDFNNMANRITNCDIANERKCLETCQKQLDAIKHIKEQNKFNDMTLRLRSIATLREMYPESSNEELSEYSSNVFGRELSKSGISHCLRALMDFYKSILLDKDK